MVLLRCDAGGWPGGGGGPYGPESTRDTPEVDAGTPAGSRPGAGLPWSHCTTRWVRVRMRNLGPESPVLQPDPPRRRHTQHRGWIVAVGSPGCGISTGRLGHRDWIEVSTDTW